MTQTHSHSQPVGWKQASWWAPAIFGYAQERITAYPRDDIWMLEVADVLEDSPELIDYAVQVALADGPRGVVCDLGDVGVEPGSPAVGQLLSLGRHVRDWPGSPIVLTCKSDELTTEIRHRDADHHLRFGRSKLEAWAELISDSGPDHANLLLRPEPKAAPIARRFLTRTYLDWGLVRVLDSALPVINELVIYTLSHSRSELELSLTRYGRDLRIAIRHEPAWDLTASPGPRDGIARATARIVNAYARAYGTLPCSDGKICVWATLHA